VPVSVGEDETNGTDRVPMITTSDEYDESDTIVVSTPKYAHSSRGTLSSDPAITGQEENNAFDNASSPAETDVVQEQLAPQEESFAFDSASSLREPEALQEHPVPQEEGFPSDSDSLPAETDVVQEQLASQEESLAFDNAASPAETDVAQDHLVPQEEAPQEEPLTEIDEPAALAESPVSEVNEKDETWVPSYSLLDTDEESAWLQPLPPSQSVEEPTWLQSITSPHTDEEQPPWLQSLTPSQTRESEEHIATGEDEEHTLFSDSSYIDEEGPGDQLTAPASNDGDDESPATVIVSSPKRHRSKRKRNELKKARMQMIPEEESDQ